MRDSAWMAIVFLVLATAGAATANAAPVAPAESGRELVLAPRGDPFLPYLADPHGVGFEFRMVSVSDVDIPDSGESRYVLRLGGRTGLARLEPRGRSGEGWQLGLEFGFIGEFDLDYSLDNIGWDGLYGLTLSSKLSDELRVKLGTMHRSSHVGDEYMARTGRQRINYTRQELNAALAWHLAPTWRLYGEYGWAYDLGNELVQQRGRAQTGLEYQPPRNWWGGQLGWFAALDISAMEERDWRADVALRAGHLFYSDARRWTFGVMHYRGRPAVGEFYQHTETYTGISLMLEM